jgi:hypothetical protein
MLKKSDTNLLSINIIDLKARIESQHLQQLAEERALLASNERAQSAARDRMAGVEQRVEEASRWQQRFQVNHQLKETFAVVYRQHVYFACNM